jgi:hypothetical protein
MTKANKTEILIVKTHKLNIRTQPSLNSKVVEGSPVVEGTELTTYTGTETNADGLVWIKVKFEGKQRWAAKDFLTPITESEEDNINEA